MAQTNFFPPVLAPSVGSIVEWTGAQPNQGADLTVVIRGVAPIDRAGPGDLAFLDNPRYAADLPKTRASAVLLQPRYSARGAGGLRRAVDQPALSGVRRGSDPLVSRRRATRIDVRRSRNLSRRLGSSGGAPGGRRCRGPRRRHRPGAEIGAGAFIGANAVIGPNVRIGRDSAVGPNCTVLCALIGDRVVLHPGVRIGQDGFGFAMGPQGHRKVPQVGRVIVQDDVEIGAGTTIDRGANRDTVIGEGSKIDNLVQIGHNVVVGRNCVIVAQAGVSGSCTIDDFVAIGGQAGMTGHLHIGAGAQIAASAGLMSDVPAGARWGGAPAQPIREFWKELAVLKKLARESKRAREASAE